MANIDDVLGTKLRCVLRSGRLLATMVFSILLLVAVMPAHAQQSQPSRVIDMKAPDGIILKATYFAAAKPGPGVLLLHQSNRDRKSWDGLAAKLSGAGINTLTLDMRGLGESGGTRSDFKRMPEDVDTALDFLTSQPGVDPQVIGFGGAGWLGVGYCLDTARRHPEKTKSLVLMSGENLRDGSEFLHQAQLPELFVFSDEDEYPPTQDAMKLLYITASSPYKKLVHYSAAEDAPWLWYETSDRSKVPSKGGHGTDLFGPHPELPGIIAHWFVTTLLKTPGHAPADTLAAASLLNQLRTPGGAVIFRSPWPDIEPLQGSVCDCVLSAARHFGDKPAIIEGETGRTLTYRQLVHDTERVAAGLACAGLRPGEPLALVLPNCIEFVLAWYGTLLAGGWVVPIPPLFTPAEMQFQIRDSGAKFVITFPECAAVLKNTVENVFVVGSNWNDLVKCDAPAPNVHSNPQDLAVLPYSSGTTGKPKGVMLTHANIVAIHAPASAAWHA